MRGRYVILPGGRERKLLFAADENTDEYFRRRPVRIAPHAIPRTPLLEAAIEQAAGSMVTMHGVTKSLDECLNMSIQGGVTDCVLHPGVHVVMGLPQVNDVDLRCLSVCVACGVAVEYHTKTKHATAVLAACRSASPLSLLALRRSTT